MAKGFQFLEANSDMISVEIYQHPDQDFYYEIRFKCTDILGLYAASSGGFTTRLSMGYADGNKFRYNVGEVTEYVGSFNIDVFNKYRFEWNGATKRYRILENDIEIISNRGATIIEGLTIFNIGKTINSPTNKGTLIIDYIDLNGLLFDFETLVNNHTKASDNKWYQITSDRVNINDMQITI